KSISFGTIAKALQEKDGWKTIAGKSEWGLFKFGLSEPTKYASGFAFLLVLAHEFGNNPGKLMVPDIQKPGLQDWMTVYKQRSSGKKYETKELMEEMLAKGPSAFDAVLTYENLALRYMNDAEGRWGKIQMIYPKFNCWMGNPYYIIDAPWSTPEQRDAAK